MYLTTSERFEMSDYITRQHVRYRMSTVIFSWKSVINAIGKLSYFMN